MKKRIIVLIMMAIAVFMCVGQPFWRDETNTYYYRCADGTRSANTTKNNYVQWAEVPSSYIYYENGQFVRVELINKRIVIERYSSDFRLLSTMTKDLQLPLYGGAFHGSEYNFLVFGQENPDEDNSTEVLRVVKYSKDWQQLGSYKAYGDNTVIPFEAGGCSITELDGELFIRSCHKMYADDKGTQHQANMKYVINEKDMTLKTKHVIVEGRGYVSHSFNQLQCHDDDLVYSIDHGDGYPGRGFYLTSYDSSLSTTRYGMIYTVPGDTGENYTGVSVGGLAKAGSNIISAINSANIDNMREWETDNQRNIILLVTPTDSFSKDSTTVVRYTDYQYNAGINVRTPQLVKISEERLLLMWEERTEEGYWTRMVMVDDHGQPLTDSIRVGVSLSDCQPIVVDKNVIWYVTNGTNVIFYKIDCSSDNSLNQYSESRIVTLNALKNVLTDYEYCMSDEETNNILLTKYIGNSGVTDLNELKQDYDLCFELNMTTYRDNSNLKSVKLSREILYLPYYCFEKCTSLEYVDLREIRHISSFAFSTCTSLKEITVPETLESMDSAVFEYCSNLKNINFEGCNIKLYNGNYLFDGCRSLKEIDLSVFDYSEVNRMTRMFYNCRSLTRLDLSPLETYDVTDMSFMFCNCINLFELDLTGFDTGNVTNMEGMFKGCISLIKIYVDDSFTVDNVTKSDSMFYDTWFIEGGNGTSYDTSHVDKDYAVIDTEATPGYLTRFQYIEEWTWNSDHSRASVILKDPNGKKVAEREAEISSITQDPTCEDPGLTFYIAYADYQGKNYYDVQIVESAEPIGHKYVFENWFWSDDYSGANAGFNCQNDYTHWHYEYVLSQKSTVEPGCTEEGMNIYTVTLEFEGNTYSDTMTETIEALGHDPVFNRLVWREDDSAYAECTCRRCCEPVQVECTVTVVSTTATCQTPGDTTYKATCSIDGEEYSATRSVTNKLRRHDVTNIDYNWSDDYSTVTAVVHCSMCEGFSETVNTAKKVIREATCQNIGEIRYTAVFKSTYLTTQTETEYLSQSDHDYVFGGFNWESEYPYALYSCSYCGTDKSIYVWKQTSSQQPTCTETGYNRVKLYVKAEDSLDGQYHEETRDEVIPALGHDYVLDHWNWNSSDPAKTTAVFVCKRNSSHRKEVTAAVTQHVDDNGNTVYEATVVLDGKTYTDTKTVGQTVVMEDPYTRIYGSNRYETSLLAADYLKEMRGVEKFDCVVLAYGHNFPDALSGSYLANLHNAPIILVKDSYAQRVRDYIKDNVKKNGTVYILGGKAVIPDSWLGSLSSNYDVRRLAGSNRYGSNIEVLKEIGYKGGDILVCVGTNFADSLSASAVELPILLVGNSLNDDQKKFLKNCSDVNFIIIGGTGAVTSSVEKELASYGKIKNRIAGTNRFHTSELIAYNFFAGANSAVLAYGRNFPDGLSGGSLAYALQGPLLLVENNEGNCAWAAWVASYFNNTERALILGGKGLISDDIVRNVLNLSGNYKIKVITNN